MVSSCAFSRVEMLAPDSSASVGVLVAVTTTVSDAVARWSWIVNWLVTTRGRSRDVEGRNLKGEARGQNLNFVTAGGQLAEVGAVPRQMWWQSSGECLSLLRTGKLVRRRQRQIAGR